MENVKTAISLQKSLFDQAEELARELNVSRSRLFVMALENYLDEYQNKRLFDKINQAIQDAPPDRAERKRVGQMRQHHKRMVKGTW
ncbi:MAG: hypothetical protein B6D41_02560 [Chloroflexi bacterium UTCFX4]|jgi:metal-responsive CopG/Arc/MetJ family transcriptional regulator|nr:MAG: hypothetical protein B6D41_02560 [Chloroflexi bacterium UTCFX4]